MRKIAKWRYKEGQVIDLSVRSGKSIEGDGISFSLYHSDGDYKLSINPTTIEVSDTGFTCERGNPMDGWLVSLHRKRFSQSTAQKLKVALADHLLQIGQWFPEKREQILAKLEFITLK